MAARASPIGQGPAMIQCAMMYYVTHLMSHGVVVELTSIENAEFIKSPGEIRVWCWIRALSRRARRANSRLLCLNAR